MFGIGYGDLVLDFSCEQIGRRASVREGEEDEESGDGEDELGHFDDWLIGRRGWLEVVIYGCQVENIGVEYFWAVRAGGFGI